MISGEGYCSCSCLDQFEMLQTTGDLLALWAAVLPLLVALGHSTLALRGRVTGLLQRYDGGLKDLDRSIPLLICRGCRRLGNRRDGLLHPRGYILERLFWYREDCSIHFAAYPQVGRRSVEAVPASRSTTAAYVSVVALAVGLVFTTIIIILSSFLSLASLFLEQSVDGFKFILFCPLRRLVLSSTRNLTLLESQLFFRVMAFP